MTWAAAIACYTVLALAPMLVVAMKIATVFLSGQQKAAEKIESNASLWLGEEGGRAIGAILDHIVQQKSGVIASIVSAVFIVVSIGGVFAEIQQAMNRVWKLKVKRGQAIMEYLRARLTSIVVLGLAAIILLASIVIAGWIAGWAVQTGLAWRVVGWTIEVVANLIALTLIFGLVFRTVPDAQIGWRTTFVGAAITAVLFLVGKCALSLYFQYSAPSSAYGAVGSLAAVLIWIYYSAQIALFGAVFTQVYAQVREQGVKPSKHAQFLTENREIETAMPSDREPGNEPLLAAAREMTDSFDDEDFAAVLDRHSAPWTADGGRSNERGKKMSSVRAAIFAGLGLAAGAFAGGYGFSRARRKEAASIGIDHRMREIERRLGKIAKIRELLEQDGLNQRIDSIKREMRRIATKAKA